jgi:hypothetical protein
MSAPPGMEPAADLARPAVKRTNTAGLDPVRVRMLTNACTQLAADHGQPIRRRDVRARVIRLMRGGYADVQTSFLRNDLGVVDPTGETAARNVDRGGAK